jgi:hypothetical protein
MAGTGRESAAPEPGASTDPDPSVRVFLFRVRGPGG